MTDYVIDLSDRRGTDFIVHDYVKYCPYCGRPLELAKEDLGHGDIEYYFTCDCEDAKLAKAIDGKIRALVAKKPKKRYGVVSVVKKID